MKLVLGEGAGLTSLEAQVPYLPINRMGTEQVVDASLTSPYRSALLQETTLQQWLENSSEIGAPPCSVLYIHNMRQSLPQIDYGLNKQDKQRMEGETNKVICPGVMQQQGWALQVFGFF